ncbi:MAG: hypothetical protein ACTSQP_19645 [Promethearchaeota archaeon]
MTLLDKTSNIKDLSKRKLLKRAKSFIFSTGLGDGTSELCKTNMIYGLAQFHLIQEKYGLSPNATFISSPDETISRNNFRWNSGLGYGGRLIWGSGKDKIIFLNIKPNCCGILVGGLNERPNFKEIIDSILEFKSSNITLDGIPLEWDFGVSNHFINIYKVKNLSKYNFPPYIFFIHGSAPEFRDDKNGIGLYVDKSPALKDLAIKEKTIFGDQYILIDSKAKDYFNFCQKVLFFSAKKRELVAEHLFDKYKKICNQPHQFLKDYNNIYLGCNCTDLDCQFIESNIFPTTLRADISAYLFEGFNNFSEEIIRNLAFYERAKSLEILDFLLSANILPHGGGYCFPKIKKVKKVIEDNFQRFFICELEGKNRVKIFKDMGNLQFEYRGRDVVFKTVQLKLGEIIARLTPIFSLTL